MHVIHGHHLREVIFNLFHSLVVRSDSGSNKAKRMWVSVDEVNVTSFNIFLQIFCQVEACRPRSYDCEPEILF
jgi:hypothetical protein